MFWSFLRLTRLEFLIGGLVLFWLGSRTGGDMSAGAYVAGQGMVTSIQLAAQYANEYFDLEADRAADNRTWFSGGSGVLAAGRLVPEVALRAAVAASVAAIAFGAAAATVDIRMSIIGLVALVASWGYSAPPFRFISRGYGELVAALVVSGLVPLTGALAAGDVSSGLLISFVVPLVLVNFAMLLAVDAPDATSDALANKLTLFVRLGERTGARVHRVVSVLAVLAIVGLAPLRSGLSTALGLAGCVSLIGSAILIGQPATGLRAQVLTGFAAASVVAVAVGLGIGDLISN